MIIRTPYFAVTSVAQALSLLPDLLLLLLVRRNRWCGPQAG